MKQIADLVRRLWQSQPAPNFQMGVFRQLIRSIRLSYRSPQSVGYSHNGVAPVGCARELGKDKSPIYAAAANLSVHQPACGAQYGSADGDKLHQLPDWSRRHEFSFTIEGCCNQK